ncbi:MAG TPA: hypothetical protein VI386_21130 [Candidatus Sulfotelmatobacter sp.]
MSPIASPKIGEPIDLHFSARYFHFNRSFAIKDVFDALVELITNCDDSYHRIFKGVQRNEDGGPVLIEYLAGKNAMLVVHDRAEGMTLQEMRHKLSDVGTRRSEQGDRGFMARGAKDCTELGNLIFESIKGERYYKSELTTKPQFIPLADGERVKNEIRERLHIRRGNGTVVTLKLDRERRLPRFDTLLRELPWHFALRDILSMTSPTQVLMKNLNKPESDGERVLYHPPTGNLIFDEEFEVPAYKVLARLRIWKAAEQLEDPSDRFRRSGFLVKAERAIHECTLFSPEFDRDPLAKKYFGRLECPSIDHLMREYDDRRERDEKPLEENPVLLIDPNRQHGLNREHPFTKALFLVPSERLRSLIAAERETEKAQKREIANRETQTRLDRLAKRASEFLRQQVEEIKELTVGDDVDKTAFDQGTMIFPTYVKLALGEERALTYYVKATLLDAKRSEHRATVVADDPAVVVLDPAFELHPHRTKDDRYLGSFRISGHTLTDSTIIHAAYDGLQDAQAVVSVTEKRIEQHLFDEPLEFEFHEYRVRDGSRRSLQIFAKYPDVIVDPTEISVASSDAAGIPIRGTCTLVPIAGSNYAQGSVVVQGRKLHATAVIRAEVNGRGAEASVRVVQQPPEAGAPIRIKLRDEDYGNFRARWADHEGEPNLLLVSARHKSLSRYLGPPPEFEGQNAPLFRVLLAEIVAESVCRKSLTLESKERTWEFRWADLKEDYLIADDVFAKFQQRMRDFVADAHEIMLSDSEVTKATAQ